MKDVSKKLFSYFSILIPFGVSFVLLEVLFFLINLQEKISEKLNFFGDKYVWATLTLGFLFSLLLFCFYKESNSEKPLNYIPNIWTGLGVFFTFVVIWEQLSSIGKLNEDSIKTLIKGVTAAFSTSIVGVCSALIFSIWIKYILSEKEKNEQKDNPKDTPEVVLSKLYESSENIVKTNQSIENTIKEFNKVVIGSLNLLRNEKISQEKSKVIILNTIEENIKGFSGDFHNKLSSLLNQLEKSLKENSSKISEKAIKETEQNLKNTIEVFNDIMQESLKKVTDINKEQIGITLKEMGSVGENSKMVLQNIAKNIENNAQNTQDKFQDLSNTIQNFDEQLQQTTSKVLEKNIGQLEKMFDRIQEWQKTAKIELETVNKSFAETVRQQINVNDTNKNVLDEVKRQIESIENLREEINGISLGINQYDDKIKEMQSRIVDIGNTISELDKIKSILQEVNKN